MAPSTVPGSNGWPGAYCGASAATISVKRLAIDSCTSTREGALQLSPWLKNRLAATVLAARSMSAKSSNTMNALLPPSSLNTRFRLLRPAYSSMRRPVRVLPVEPSASTSMCSARASPASGP